MVSRSIPTPTYFAFWFTSRGASYPIFSHSWICSILLFLSATGTLPLVQSIVQPLLSSLALFLLRITFIVTAVMSFLHQSGALRRYAMKFAEDELSKNLNRTLITLTDLEVDLWRGRVVARDLIIHNKDRKHWEWDSPCLARLGRIEATLNFASVINLPLIGRILNHTFFDVYTILVEDVQVFVEKRKNVFNFHLLDASLDIPNYKLIMESHTRMKMKKKKQDFGNTPLVLSKSLSLDREEEQGDFVGAREEEIPDREKEEEANRIVKKLVGAVSQIGKAANKGGSRGFQSALKNEKDGLVENLKQLHTQKKLSRTDYSSSSDGKDSRKTKKENRMSVMQELGKVVEKNVADIKDQVAFLQKPPGKKKGWQPKPPDIIRVGSILSREVRIFTKDILVSKGGNRRNTLNETSVIVSQHGGRVAKEGGNDDSSRYGWARPIVFIELAITGAELCPPMSARDPTTGMPVVGISIDRLVDIILKRTMAEAAKSNTGRLFQAAFGDVFSSLSRRED